MRRLWFVLTMALLATGCSPVTPTETAPTATITITPAPSQAPLSPTPPSPTASPVLGPMARGIPTTVDGVQVFIGDAARGKIKTSTSGEAFLVGGWFHEGRPRIFCPAYLYGTRWGCNAWIPLYPDQTASGALTIYPSVPTTLSEDDLYSVLRAVVLRVHTHDPACTPDVKDCASLPVEEGVVWFGLAP